MVAGDRLNTVDPTLLTERGLREETADVVKGAQSAEEAREKLMVRFVPRPANLTVREIEGRFQVTMILENTDIIFSVDK